MKKQTHAKHPAGNSEYNIMEDIENIKAALADASRDVKGRAGEILSNSVDSVKDKSQEIQENVADYASENPYKSIGIAAAVGFAMGFLFRK